MRASLLLCAVGAAVSTSIESARARIDALPRDSLASKIPVNRLGAACTGCSAGSFTQLVNCLSNDNVCVQLTSSFTVIDTVEIAIPSYALIQTAPGLKARTLTGNGRPLFLVKNIDATLALDNVNIINGVSEFSGYQGGGGAVQVTAGNFTAVGTIFAGCTSRQQATTQVDIGGGAVSCMDQASTLILAASGFIDNACIGCSGGAVFSSCYTFIGDTEFYNNSIIPAEVAGGTDSAVITGSALRSAQIGNTLYFVNSTVYANGVFVAAERLPAVSLSSTAGVTTSIVSNVSFGDNAGGGILFATNAAGVPAFTFLVGNSTFANNSALNAAGGAISAVILTGTGALGVADSVFSGNVGLVGGAVSVVDGNETNLTPLYLNDNTFACNGAVYGVGNALNNGDTKGGDTVKLFQSTGNNFLNVKGCPAQTVLGPCVGAPGQCPEK